MKEYLNRLLQEENISLSDRQLSQLFTFYSLLTEKNKVMNLTAITDFEEVCVKHYLDSLAILKLPEFQPFYENTSLIDVGCGAGFPGLVIAIACPAIQVTLLDSLQKRILFLQEVIEKLELTNCTALHARAEEPSKKPEYREQYDLAVSRAVANLNVLSEYCLPYVKPGGLFIAYKSAKIKEEAPEAQNAITLLGGKVLRSEEFELQSAGYRCLYIVEKEKNTPKKYPRKAGLVSKQPLS